MKWTVKSQEVEESYRIAVNYLVEAQNIDGSWNYGPNYTQTDPWTTAENIIAILFVKDDTYFDSRDIKRVCGSAVDWLLKNQNSDGGWRCVYYSQGLESVIAGTSYVVMALDLYAKVFSMSQEINLAVNKALKWILVNQNNDGGWNSTGEKTERSHIGCTAFAVRALNGHMKKIGVAEAIQSAHYYLTEYYDSGWKYSPLHETDSSLTNYVLKMLIELEARGRHEINKEIILKTIKSMLSIQHEDGTWSDWQGVSSSIEATALFVENYCLIVRKTRFGKNQLKRAIKRLLEEQRENGSWGQEVGNREEAPYWITHNCVLAIKSVANQISNDWPNYIEKINITENVLWKSRYRFDVVLSFAGEDREYVENIYLLLRNRHVRVFYDDEFRSELWGEDLTEKLDEIYRTDTKYCMIFCSKYYSKKKWAVLEKRSAKAAQFDNGRYDYILPILLDDTEIPGILKTSGYLDARELSSEKIVEIFLEKLNNFKED